MICEFNGEPPEGLDPDDPAMIAEKPTGETRPDFLPEVTFSALHAGGTGGIPGELLVRALAHPIVIMEEASSGSTGFTFWLRFPG